MNSMVVDKYNPVIKKSWLYLLLLYIEGLFIVFVSDKVLPAKYFFDAETIKQNYQYVNEMRIGWFDSYLNTARFYNLFGFEYLHSRIAEGIFTYSLLFICLVFIYCHVSTRISSKVFFILLIWNIPSAVYFGQLTKEIVITLVLTLFIYLVEKKSKIYWLVAFILVSAYAALFRNYWFLIIYFTVVCWILIKGYINSSHHIIRLNVVTRTILLLFSVLLLFGLAASNGVFLTDSRASVNVGREFDPNSVTLINNIIKNESLYTDLVNWIVSWLLLLMPFKLILKAEPQHLLFAIWNIINIVIFIRLKNRYKKLYNTSSGIRWSISWIIAFSLVQGIYEPDFGSFVKHEIVLLPMFFFMLLYYQKTKESLPQSEGTGEIK